MVSAEALYDWENMMLAVDMRPGVSPHSELWQNGNCNLRRTLAYMRICHLIFIAIVSVSWELNLWHYHATVLIEGKCIPTKSGYIVQLPNPMMANCQTWRYNPTYNNGWVWPDSYQECNSSIVHRHEHDNHCHLWQSVPHKCFQNSICKACCYQNDGVRHLKMCTQRVYADLVEVQ
jgi:hypothetical protein